MVLCFREESTSIRVVNFDGGTSREERIKVLSTRSMGNQDKRYRMKQDWVDALMTNYSASTDSKLKVKN
jgi:hypothetical protein